MTQATVTPISPLLGAEIRGYDVRGAVDTAAHEWIVGLLDEYQMVVFRDQNLTPAELTGFSARFGPLQPHILDQFHLAGHPEIYILSNLKENGRPIGNANDGITWHTDLTGDEHARVYTILYSLEVPSTGGDTLFASTQRAWDALPAERKRDLEGKRAIHSYEQLYNSRRKMLDEAGIPNDYQPLTDEQVEKARAMRRFTPLVRTHPNSRRKGLYLGTLSVEGIEGMPGDSGLGLMAELVDYVTGEPFKVAHKWQVRDLVMWDNRGLMHVATPYDKQNDRRIVYRVSVEGPPPI